MYLSFYFYSFIGVSVWKYLFFLHMPAEAALSVFGCHRCVGSDSTRPRDKLKIGNPSGGGKGSRRRGRVSSSRQCTPAVRKLSSASGWRFNLTSSRTERARKSAMNLGCALGAVLSYNSERREALKYNWCRPVVWDREKDLVFDSFVSIFFSNFDSTRKTYV